MTTFANGESGLDVRTKINAAISDIDRIDGYLEIASAAGSTVLTNTSASKIRVTGTLAQNIVLPVVTTLSFGWFYIITNDSTASITIQSSGLNTVRTLTTGTTALVQCILITGTTAASWASDVMAFSTLIPVVLGGTNIASYTIGDILFASAAGVLTPLADVATGNVLISGGVGVAPSYGKVGLTTHVSGILPVANGGTNLASYAVGDLLFASAATTIAKLADVATGNVLISGGVGVAPSYGKVGLTTHVSGTLAVANGGTGAATLTGYVIAAGTAAMTASATIPNTDVSGLGTMSTQAASGVAITGGTINGASVGATTASTVRGSSLTSTSVITDSFVTRAAGTLALAFATNGVVQVTPNATGTFTTTVPPAGTRCTLIVLTSGATSFTMTFGTGFKTTGTLATGVTTARYFIFEFISDGTNLIESSRTVAIA